MSDYLLMLLEDEGAHAAQSPTAMADLIERRAEFTDSLQRAGQLLDRARLRPSKEGKRVRRERGEVRVTDGPFAEDGKALGGFYCVTAESADEAATLAAACPTLATDAIDVRPVMKGKLQADKEAKPGKIFAFAVLGREPTEEAWVQVMDRIDAEGLKGTVQAAMLGGVRLQPPRTGKRVATQGERRATFDGPFLESKEVIGGVIFARMASLDEAVEWLRNANFLTHGGVEIRELWRS